MNKITLKLPFLALLLLALPFPATAQTISGKVSWIYDGDTFKLRGKRIRVCGIDAPEHDAPGGSAATSFLIKHIKGKRVKCTVVGGGTVCDGRSRARNKNRLVAQCFIDGQDIAAMLVQSGHACDWVRFSGGAYPGGCRK